MKVILEGITGSKAYGLDTPESDTDIKGVILYPTEKILSLSKGKETVNRTDPDIEHHEVEKFIRLASKCNPSILELLFLENYRILTDEGKLLVSIRNAFLNKTIYNSYGGYAVQQAKRLYKKAQQGAKHTRHDKHARHCFRLLFQGKELLETGSLTVRLKNPQIFFDIGQMPIDEMIDLFEIKLRELNDTKTDLPEKPDYDLINKTLLSIRRDNYNV